MATEAFTYEQARELGYVLQVGQVQEGLLFRARRSKVGMVMPGSYREVRALRALVKRGVMEPALSYPNVWQLTDRGRYSWLQVS